MRFDIDDGGFVRFSYVWTNSKLGPRRRGPKYWHDEECHITDLKRDLELRSPEDVVFSSVRVWR